MLIQLLYYIIVFDSVFFQLMLRRTKHCLETVTEGDNVIVPIPAVDRGPLDPSNIQGVILSVTGDGYKIGSKQGQLHGKFARNMFEKINSNLCSWPRPFPLLM